MTATKRKGRILTSAEEMQSAARAALEREKTATKICDARYDAECDAIVVELSTGATLGVPRRAIAGFATAPPRALSDIGINPGGESLWSDAADDGVLLEQLVEIAAGEDFLKVLGGRISGRRRSPAKARASRENGAKGGRPPLSMGTFIRSLDAALHDLVPNAPYANTAENPNPNTPASATWRAGDHTLLYVKIHGAHEVQLLADWPRKRPIERRIRATADRLARELARRLVERTHSEAAIRTAETHALAQRARARKDVAAKKRPANRP